MLLACLLAGYWLGAHNSRVLPYQMDQVCGGRQGGRQGGRHVGSTHMKFIVWCVTQNGNSSSISSNSWRGWIRPWMLLVCWVAGYWLGAHNKVLTCQMVSAEGVCVWGGGEGRQLRWLWASCLVLGRGGGVSQLFT
jgi:hypothetical protein